MKKLHSDKRGTINLISASAFGEIIEITTNSGMTRGNHFHIEKNEVFYIRAGEGKIVERDFITGKIVEKKVRAGDYHFIISPNPHEIINTGSESLVIGKYSSKPFNPDDTISYEIRGGNNEKKK